MGSKRVDHKQKFLEKGLTPLEEIRDFKQKVPCIDKEGYKYYLSYRGAVGDKRTKTFDKWDKTNPFKAHNMRLYAEKLNENICILSTDEELFNASVGKIKFKCPICGEIYEKKWCHWLGQSKGEHNCPKCNFAKQKEKAKLSHEELIKRFEEHGLKLISDYAEYQGNHTSLVCKNNEGYRFYTNINILCQGGFKHHCKFSKTNPNALYNLQLWCDKNNIKVKVLNYANTKDKIKFQCSCGNTFETTINSFIQGKQRCDKCVALDSKYSLLTKKWLESHNINYIQEFRFEDCRDKKPLPFDYRVDWEDKVILIEVDGGQHYYITQWTDKDKLELQQKHDRIKDNYCKENGYQMVRIPFWLYKTEAYKDILNKTFFG